MTNEKMLLNFSHRQTYNNTPENQVGASIQTGKRTIPIPGGAVYYVRKFGTDYLITDVTDIEDPIDVNMTFAVYANDGTLLGSRVGGGVFIDGSTVTAQGCYMVITASGGDVAVLNNILVDTDIDAGGLDFITAQETIYDGDTLTLYLSDTGSTYYDSTYQRGGGRHTPVVANTRKPFFHPYDPLNDGAWGNDDGIEIVDSETYSFPYKDDGGTWRYKLPLSVTPCYLYSTDGQNLKIKGIIGADTEREVSELFNNLTAVFFNENGTNVDVAATGYRDTWHDPYGTIANAITAATNKGVTLVIYGGVSAASGTITELVVLNAAYTIEPEYGYTPTITGAGNTISLTHINANVYGLTVTSLTAGGIYYNVLNAAGEIGNCTCKNTVTNGIRSGDRNNGLTFKYNKVFGNARGIYFSGSVGVSSENIIGNICYNNTIAGVNWEMNLNTETVVMYDNVIYNNYQGMRIVEINAGGTFVGTIENNTIYNNSNIGIYSSTVGGIAATFRNMIVYGNLADDLYRGGARPTITESNYGVNRDAPFDWNIGAGCITIDPEFCKTTGPFKLGISADSGAYRTDTSTDDMGAHFRLIEINADSIEINGIQIDGNDQFNNAIYIVDNAHHKDCIIKWCNIFDFQGIAIDLFDDALMDETISNNLIFQNGDGINLVFGGNTVNENCIYNNGNHGIYNKGLNTYNHNVIYGNQKGLNIAVTSEGVNIKNCIFNRNSLYGINSDVAVIITYCCITDAINSNVDITDVTNFIVNPLFISTASGSEDFNIKTISQESFYDSVCKDASDDTSFPDIGAYDILRSTIDNYWKKHQFDNNPLNFKWKDITKGARKFENILGSTRLWGKGYKRQFALSWNNQYATQQLREKIAYISTLFEAKENDLTEEQVKIRFNPLLDQGIETGTNGVISAKTITDITKDWNENAHKGYHVGVKFDSDTGTEEFYAGMEIDLSE